MSLFRHSLLLDWGRLWRKLPVAGSNMKNVIVPGLILLLSGLYSISACSRADGSAKKVTEAPANEGHLFTRLPSSYTGVQFENRLTDTREMNIFTYRNYYNGGGVALADLTGDGLPEVLLTPNQGGSKLYLNKGNYRFDHVPEKPGAKGDGFSAP